MKKEFKKMVSWFFIFMFIFNIMQPMKTYAFGYRTGNIEDTITLKEGDILRKGQTYKIHRFISELYSDSSKISDITLENVDADFLTNDLDAYATIHECINDNGTGESVYKMDTVFTDVYTGTLRKEYEVRNDYKNKVAKLETKDTDTDNAYVEITPTENIIFNSVQFTWGSNIKSVVYLQFYKIPDTNLLDTLKIGDILEGGKTYGFLYDDTIDKTGFAERNAYYNEFSDAHELLHYGSARPDIFNYSGNETDATTIRAISMINYGTGRYSPYSKVYIDDNIYNSVQGALLGSYLFTQNGEEYQDLDGGKKVLPSYGVWKYPIASWKISNVDCTPGLTIITLPEGYNYKYVKNPYGNTYYFKTVTEGTVNYISKRTHNKIYQKTIEINTSGALTDQDKQIEPELSNYNTDKYYVYFKDTDTYTETDVSNLSKDMDLYLSDIYCYVEYKDFDTAKTIGYRKIQKGDVVDFDSKATYYSDPGMQNTKSYDDIISSYRNKSVTYFKDKNDSVITSEDTKADELTVYVKGSTNMNKLTIKNTVSGNNSSTTDVFVYSLMLTDYIDNNVTYCKNEIYDTVTVVNNKVEFTLTGNDLIVFDLPKDTSYSVELIKNNGYTANITKSGGVLSENREIEFGLSKVKQEITPINPTPSNPAPDEPVVPIPSHPTPDEPMVPDTPNIRHDPGQNDNIETNEPTTDENNPKSLESVENKEDANKSKKSNKVNKKSSKITAPQTGDQGSFLIKLSMAVLAIGIILVTIGLNGRKKKNNK